jgi:hypothetical protein
MVKSEPMTKHDARSGVEPPWRAGMRLSAARARGVATSRRFRRACAGVLVVLGAVALVALPNGRTRAEAQLTVAPPFTTSDVLHAMRSVAHGATVRAAGSQVDIALTASNRRTARALAAKRAHIGLEAALRNFTASADGQTAAARGLEAQAATQLATLAARTGLADPTFAYQRLEGVVRGLERQREMAATAGMPPGPIDATLAENQQAMFELRAQVTRHDELVQTEAQARQQELKAAATSDAATSTARATTVDVADYNTEPWPIPIAVVIFGLALIVFLGSEPQLRRRSQLPSRRGADSLPIHHEAPRRAPSRRDARVTPEPR